MRSLRTGNGFSADEQAEISKAVSGVADRHRRFPEARWAMTAEGVAELDAFLTERGAVIEQSSSLFSWWPKNIDSTTDEGRDELQRRRIEAVQKLLGDGIVGVLMLAQAVELSYSVGYAVGQATTELDDQILDLIDSDDLKSRDLAIGLASLRSQTPGWLAQTVGQRRDQAGWLLLTQQATSDILDLVADISEDQQNLYWSQVDPVRRHDALERFVDSLLAADRPYSAIDAVSFKDGPAQDLILRVLRAPITLDFRVFGSAERRGAGLSLA